ncbi:MAG: nitroreductase [Bacteroidetes bacterium GWF2_43_63]|nr:MAG: nitroreductase [Bacteroidetes bacterium GWE2_42_42]OFY54149.1 MAG: nitroreductase [Bacteroidetes bacterium GWF2_43_63]HBG70813.1 nitroreductase [Bacteroidales bacterium]HCB61717.1 nitroreductase [Bacteroidales bacterium]HCY22093.1 nitroreductase [Bacteroidales bacterium]
MDAIKMIQERRSVNNFDPTRKLDNETLKKIVDLAVHAPSAYNLQPWRIIVVQSDEAKEKFWNLAYKQPKIKDAAVNLLIVGNKNGWDKENPVWDEMLKTVGGNVEAVEGAQKGTAYSYGSTEERRIAFAQANAGLLSMSIMYAASTLGIDSHPMNGYDYDGVHKEFGLAEHEMPVMNICLGFFDQSKTLNPRRPRRGFEEITKVF